MPRPSKQKMQNRSIASSGGKAKRRKLEQAGDDPPGIPEEPDMKEYQGSNQPNLDIASSEDLYIPDIMVNEPQEDSRLGQESISDHVDQPNVAPPVRDYLPNPVTDLEPGNLGYESESEQKVDDRSTDDDTRSEIDNVDAPDPINDSLSEEYENIKGKVTHPFNKSMRYVDAYRRGLNAKEAAWANKRFRGHRVLPACVMQEVEAEFRHQSCNSPKNSM